ncbi:helix-turn-helix domain-containing protein [Lactiplantibacillus sp. DA1]|uniref:winged helix-turn-helix transcriptional regulator n=1 Tax=Lactiplantibacillus sp. DA1 TaxID=3079857 RepID=UPI00292A5F29|nr:helix-turn-helix domain-containing protein [Lactiplantibacillus sp. DA1]MDV0430695.1 helix-turn-helix domain-containing protein [Lactiplantibacillus sp. DA1]
MIKDDLLEEVFNIDLSETGFGYTLNKIGGKYKISILNVIALKKAPMRYNELKRTLDSIPSKFLANSLNDFTMDGLINRKQYLEIPPRVEYDLTVLGKNLVHF